MSAQPNPSPTIRIHPADDVVIARQQLVSGSVVAQEGFTVSGLVPPGHKIAAHDIAEGAPVRRYNQVIGTATQPIRAGQHVHTHNLAFSSFEREHAAGAEARATEYVATTGHVRRHRARRRPRGHAQLHRHPDLGELLGHRGAGHCRPLPRRPAPRGAGRVTRTWTAWWRSRMAAAAPPTAKARACGVLRRTLGGYARHPELCGHPGGGAGLRDQPDRRA